MLTTLGLPGVYMIRCRPTGEFYIGGTKRTFVERFHSHLQLLRKQKHPSARLQAAFDQYGAEEIEFLALKFWPADQVHDREREAIFKLSPKFNPRPGVTAVPVRALAEQSGLSAQIIYARAKRGLTGADLIAPPHRCGRKQYTRQK